MQELREPGNIQIKLVKIYLGSFNLLIVIVLIEHFILLLRNLLLSMELNSGFIRQEQELSFSLRRHQSKKSLSKLKMPYLRLLMISQPKILI